MSPAGTGVAVENSRILKKVSGQADKVTSALDSLSEPQRRTLLLRFYGDLEFSEIAKSLEQYHDFFMQTFAGFFSSPEALSTSTSASNVRVPVSMDSAFRTSVP